MFLPITLIFFVVDMFFYLPWSKEREIYFEKNKCFNPKHISLPSTQKSQFLLYSPFTKLIFQFDFFCCKTKSLKYPFKTGWVGGRSNKSIFHPVRQCQSNLHPSRPTRIPLCQILPPPSISSQGQKNNLLAYSKALKPWKT